MSRQNRPVDDRQRVFLRAEWRHLALANWTIEPRLLAPWIPRGTEIDSWSGKTFVSVVGFRFLRTRVLGIAVPFHRDFDEINLRLYVRRRTAAGWRRGVVFVREVVPRVAIAAAARWLYNENYVACRTSSRNRRPTEEQPGGATYVWSRDDRTFALKLSYGGDAFFPTPGSQEEFITEHYWGYSSQRNGTTLEYRVEHPQWRIWRADSARLSGDVASFYGRAFAEALAAPPASAFVAEGSPIVVRRGRGIPAEPAVYTAEEQDRDGSAGGIDATPG